MQLIVTKSYFRFTKASSVDNAVQCPGKDGLNDLAFPDGVKINQIGYVSTSCSSMLTQPKHQIIDDDDDGISTSSSVDTCSQSNCGYYTCCEIEGCTEKVAVLTQCPKKANSLSTDINKSPETEYKGKDLINYLGMLDCVSSSIAEQKVCEFCLNQNENFAADRHMLCVSFARFK